ncbi:unnamed protein product [Adineta steineri]|uniref:BK channel n=1 Tax=Adineta steineri TaxID=433720 RepID=A0A814SNR4_9BILA|nr:unnamed protein product [Adineta steineri]CAF1148425.1 unnamed protein product [Adineta steineri]
MGNCPTTPSEFASSSLDPLCNGERMWTTFLFSSLFTLFGGWFIILIYDFMKMLLIKRRRSRFIATCKHYSRVNEFSIRRQSLPWTAPDRGNEELSEDYFSWLQAIKEWENNLISGQTKMGKTLVGVVFICSIASLILYFVDTKNAYIESCTEFSKSFTMQADLGLNVLFLVYFFLRFTASQHKRRFWFSLYSIVDMFTIPPSFVALYLNRNWIGFRFLRAIRIMNTPDILQYMGLIERPRTIRIVQLASRFIAVWVAAAGAVHLAENSGDFFCNFQNAQELDVFNAIYFMIVTMTTVGYGDVFCKTYIGKLFMLMFLIGGLAFFATMIPEFSSLFGSTGQYSGRYRIVKGKQHVIICGHITPHSMTTFLRDFLHKDRDQAEELDIVIINKKTPEIEMEALLKRYYTKVQYFVGTVMNVADLHRIQVNKATACLIIADKECPDPDGDDSANIMRVISLKNFNQRIRVLLQLLQYKNKMNVASIPGWSSKDGDEIICIAELKLGLIGMSCAVPGFCTMMTNIFRMSAYKTRQSQELTQAWHWRELYHRGAAMEMYLEELPRSFQGKTFIEAALICFKLRVMLLAVEIKHVDDNGNTRLIVEVAPKDDCIILSGTRAFMVCSSSEDAKRVKFYCAVCYPNVDQLTVAQLKRMRRCRHTIVADDVAPMETLAESQLSIGKEKSKNNIVRLLEGDVRRPLLICQSEPTDTVSLTHSEPPTDENMSSFDSTGMFYFVPPRRIEEAVLHMESLRERRLAFRRQNTVKDGKPFDYQRSHFVPPTHPVRFQDHVIVCLHADHSSPTIGLRNFVMPLRASSFHRNELPIIIFVTDLDYIKHEWDMIATFPDIYILNGSPSNPYNLQLICIQDCRQCVIISTLDRDNQDTYLVDKSSVLCTLNIRQIEMKSAGFVSVMNLTGQSTLDMHTNQTMALLQNKIRTLTTLTIDSNVQYVEQGDTDEVDLEFYLTTPFASGAAFADSVLDCILSCAYYNDNAVNLLRNILTGGVDVQLEEILAEGGGFTQCESTDILKKRNRARVAVLEIRELIPDIDIRTTPVTFSVLFCEAIQRYQMIVMGIYRLLDVLLRNDPTANINRLTGGHKRIVLCYPPYNYHMDPSDMIYVMQQSRPHNDQFSRQNSESISQIR